jgi:hypothetical protein
VTIWPYVPETSITEARSNELARRRRDREEARAAGLAPGEVGPFLAALRVFDANTPAWEERMALERARVLRDERLRIEAEEGAHG